LVLSITLLLSQPLAASAQWAAGADFALRTRYVWRGVLRTHQPVVQPSVFLSWQPTGWTITAGSWASLEPWRATRNQFTDAGRTTTLAELNYWLEAHTRTSRFDLRLGTIRYDLHGDGQAGGRDNVWDTGEVYGAAAVMLSRLNTLGVTAAYDYATIDGAYVTLELLQHVPLFEVHDLMLSFLLRGELAGSLGQAHADQDSSEPAYYDQDGITHLDFAAALRAHTTRIAFHATGHLQFNQDRLTRRITASRNGPRLTWLEVGVAVAVGPGARERP
jgi:hypothetical protein